MKATKKPVVIDYFPIDTSSNEGLLEFVKELGYNIEDVLEFSDGKMKVKTKEGHSYDLTNEDMLIKGITNDFYPCKKTNIFSNL